MFSVYKFELPHDGKTTTIELPVNCLILHICRSRRHPASLDVHYMADHSMHAKGKIRRFTVLEVGNSTEHSFVKYIGTAEGVFPAHVFEVEYVA